MIGTLIKRWPRTFRYGAVGLLSGAFVGFLIGGIGIAMRGGAFGVNTGLVLAIAGAFFGGRIGMKRDGIDRKMEETAS